MKTFFTVEDGVIGKVQQTNGETPAGQDNWREGPNDLYMYVGQKIEWFDENMNRIPDDELIKQGKRKDNRGKWYNKNSISDTKLIYNMDEDAGDDWTQEAPLENEPHQEFDKKLNKWVVNEKKKERAEKETAVSEIQAEITTAEQRIIRPMRAINAGRATKYDKEVFEKYDALIEDELRPKLQQLEKELEST